MGGTKNKKEIQIFKDFLYSYACGRKTKKMAIISIKTLVKIVKIHGPLALQNFRLYGGTNMTMHIVKVSKILLKAAQSVT
jgi:hypothetical protein